MDALEKIKTIRPDVVTMDIEMPKMDGLSTLQRVLDECPLPVIMISAMDKRQADITMKALEFGAVDFISKTSGTLSLDIEKKQNELISKVLAASKVEVARIEREKIIPIPSHEFKVSSDFWIVTIGASTGGPRAIQDVLSRLPRNIPAAILIVQHMPEGFTRSFAERLNWYTSLEVKEAEDGDLLKKGLVLIAPGNYHMEVKGEKISLTQKPSVNHVRPSVDVLMNSIAEFYGPKSIGVILTGMGIDGCEGIKNIKYAGGRTIAQDKKTSVINGMPQAAVNLGVVDTVKPLQEIADEIIKLMEA
jgi:two-component system chemotaxis response regulator CheB